MLIFWTSTDIRDNASEIVWGIIYASITDADYEPLMPYYEFLVGDDTRLKKAVEMAACDGDDEETFLLAIMENCHPPAIPVEPFWKELHAAATNVVQRTWPDVQHLLEPFNETERGNLAEDMVRRVREDLVISLNDIQS